LKINIWLFITAILCGILISCTDDPNSVGSVLVPQNDKLKTIVIDSRLDNFEQEFISYQKESLFFGSASRILLGSYKNISSEALLAFIISLPDSIRSPLDSNNSITLRSSWIELYPNYWLGDSSNINFTAHEIRTSWNSIVFNEDSVTKIRNSLGPNILEEIIFSPGDTVIKITVDNELINNWVFRSFDDSYPENRGILFAPVSNTGIAGFQGITTFPNTSYPTLHLEFEKEGDFIDTVLSVPNLDMHLPVGEQLIDPPDEVLLQGSIGVRGKLKFELNQIPKDILVNKAVLKLFVNNFNSFEANVKTDTIAISAFYNFQSD